VELAFAHPPVSKADLMAHATANHARVDILNALGRLPDQSFRHLRDLWPHLTGIPVDR
jgi:hypothetical protein